MSGPKESHTGPVGRWREKRRVKRERSGPSAEAEQEQRNADKVADSRVVVKNAAKILPPG